MTPASSEKNSAPPVPPDRREQLFRLLAALAALAGAGLLAAPLIRVRAAKLTMARGEMVGPSSDGEGAELIESHRGSGGTHLLYVDSVPEGATAKIDGEDQGETPVSTEVHCVVGSSIAIELSHPGYRTYKRSVPCSPDTLTRLQPKLVRR